MGDKRGRRSGPSSSRTRRDAGRPAPVRPGGRRTTPAREAPPAERAPSGALADLPGLRRLLGVLSIALLAGIGLTLFVTSPVFGVREVLLLGSSHLTSDEVVRLCDVPLGTNILKVPTLRIRDRLLGHPRVEKATVSRRFPNRLLIQVVEREGVALVACHERYAELDATGRPLELHRFIGALGLPVITGVDVDGVTLGLRLDDERLLTALLCASALGREGRSAVAEIHLTAGGELVVYTRSGVPAYFGEATGLEVKAGVLAGILKDIALEGLEVSYIDVRYPRYPVLGSAVPAVSQEEWPDPDAVLLGGP